LDIAPEIWIPAVLQELGGALIGEACKEDFFMLLIYYLYIELTWASRSRYIGTVEGIFEYQLNVQDRKTFPILSYR
jgi:hypothetical protein